MLEKLPDLGADQLLVGEGVVVGVETPECPAVPMQQPVVIVDETRLDQRAGRLHWVARVEHERLAISLPSDAQLVSPLSARFVVALLR